MRKDKSPWKFPSQGWGPHLVTPIRTAVRVALLLPRSSAGHVSTRPAEEKSTLSSVLFSKHETRSKAESGRRVCLGTATSSVQAACCAGRRGGIGPGPTTQLSRVCRLNYYLCLQIWAFSKYIYHFKIQRELEHNLEVHARGKAVVDGFPTPSPLPGTPAIHRCFQKPAIPVSQVALWFSLQLSWEHKKTAHI